jgi:hypothetical protein
MKAAPLAGTLTFLLPEPAEAALLRVCLSRGRAREAWDEWMRLGGDLDRYRSLLPQVDEGARRGGLELDEPLGALLSGARLHESLRLSAIRQIAGEVLDRLAQRGVDPVVVQDLALAETVYADPALRHCHALELLLPPRAVADARAVLGDEMARRDGFPVLLSGRPLHHVVPGAGAAGILARAIDAEIAGRRARVPAPEDALVLVLGRAAVGAERRTLLWACDAARSIEAAPAIDWNAVAELAGEWGLGVPIAALLGWLASELSVAVPHTTIEHVARIPPRGRRRARAVEAALECVRADGRAGPASLLVRSDGWRERASVLRWTIFPSASRLRRAYPDVPRSALPLVYLARPFLYAARRMLGALTGLRRHPDAGRELRAPGAGMAAARSEGRQALAADRPSASRRSWE